VKPTSVVRIPSSASAAIQVPMPYQAIAGTARRNSTIFEPRTPNPDRVWIRYGIPYLFPGSPLSENMTTATSTASTITRKAWNRFMLPFGGRNPCPSTKAWMTISDDHHMNT